MDFDEAAALARRLMKEHHLNGWQFKFDRAKRRFGGCWQKRKLITLSKPLTILNDVDEVRDTILHEIAHALAPGGHHRAWRQKCIEIGAKPVRCYTGATVAMPTIQRRRRYVSRCACNIEHVKFRCPTRKYLCRKCRTILSWTLEQAVVQVTAR